VGAVRVVVGPTCGPVNPGEYPLFNLVHLTEHKTGWASQTTRATETPPLTNHHNNKEGKGKEMIPRILEKITTWFNRRGFFVYVGTLGSTPETKYVGDLRWAYRLARLGIIPELADPLNNVCSIGYSDKTFKAGDKLAPNDRGRMEMYDILMKRDSVWQDPEDGIFIAGNLNDAREFAIAFAKSVS
jgi:hypothetical protein